MDLLEYLLLGGGHPGLLAHELFQGQAVQGLQAGHLGVADVQVLQIFTAGKIVNAFQLVAVCQLQKFQLLAVFKALELLDRAAGGNENFQVRHVAYEAQVRQGVVVADVHVLGAPAVLEVFAGIIKHVVHGPDGFLIGHGGILAEADPPHQLRSGIVGPDFRHFLVGQAAVVQNKGIAVRHHRQGGPEGGFVRFRQAQIPEFHLGIVGGDGLAEEGEGVVEAGLGGGVYQNLHIGKGQGGAAAAHELHGFQQGHPTQCFGGRQHVAGLQRGQIHGGCARVVFLARKAQGVADFQLRVLLLEVFQLFRGEIGFRQNQPLGILQILQVGHQGFVIRLPRGKVDLLQTVGDLHGAQGNGVGYGDLRVVPGVDLQGWVAGAAGGVQTLQIGVVFQGTHVFIGDDHLQMGGLQARILRCLGTGRGGGGRGGFTAAAGEHRHQQQNQAAAAQLFFQERIFRYVKSHRGKPPVNIMQILYHKEDLNARKPVKNLGFGKKFWIR